MAAIHLAREGCLRSRACPCACAFPQHRRRLRMGLLGLGLGLGLQLLVGRLQLWGRSFWDIGGQG